MLAVAAALKRGRKGHKSSVFKGLRAFVGFVVSVSLGLFTARFAFYRSFDFMPNRDGLAPALVGLAVGGSIFLATTALALFVVGSVFNRNRGS